MIVRVGHEHRGGLVGIGVVGDDHFEVTRLRKGGFEYVRQERASVPRWDEDREPSHGRETKRPASGVDVCRRRPRKHQPITRYAALAKIGRASCRERGWVAGGGEEGKK